MSAFHRHINRAPIAPVQRTSLNASACARHEKMIKRVFDRFAAKWGVSYDEAAILLLDTGVRLPD